MRYQKLRGTTDIFVPEAKLWQRIEKISQSLFESFGYQEIRTPVIEPLELFQRSIGEATEIVEKEIFQFQDKSGREISLRPEATASVVRAYIENSLFQVGGILKLYYIGAMFRAERPQKGRRRQFHQIGVEAIGSYQPEMDAEIIYLSKILLDRLGIDDFVIEINNLGCKKDKKRISLYLKDKIAKHLTGFCQDCQRRFERNVLRIMDCKNSLCQDSLRKLKIDISQVICKDCLQHYQEVKDLLSVLDLSYRDNNYLARGIDYYTRTVFEVLSPRLGAQNAIGGGGRYDNLVEEMGGKPTGATGFAFGIERMILLLSEQKVEIKPPLVFLALQDRKYLKEGLRLIMELRQAGIYAEMDYQARSLKSQMRLADQKKTNFVLILGSEELQRSEFSVKDMASGSQVRVKKEGLIDFLKRS